MNKARVRLLTTPVGMWSKARDFYTRWEALPGVNALARRFPLAGAKSGASVIVFKSAPPRSQKDGPGREGEGGCGGRAKLGVRRVQGVAGAQRSTALAAGAVPREACTHQACRPRGLSPTNAQAEQASLLDTQLGPTGTLQPLAEDPAFTMCSRAKTFCPCCNFASSAGRG